MKIIKQKSPYPFLIAGAIWLLMGAITPIYKLWAIILTLVLSVGGYYLGRMFIFKDKEIEVATPVDTGDAAANELIRNGREAINKLRGLNEQIPDEHISSCIDRMEKAGGAIFDKIEAEPSKARLVRRFLNYYLPTTEKLLDSYKQMQTLESGGENVDNMKTSISNSMDLIATAFEKQLDALYRDNALDIESDIRVLQTLMAADGNTDKEGVTLSL